LKRVVLASLVLFLLATGARAQIFLSAEDAAGATADAASQGAAAGLSGSDTVDRAASSLDATVTSPAGRAALAMSTPDYPVTIGDVYSVVFLTAGGTVTIEAPVEADYRFALPNLVPLNLKGLTFPQFRDQAEKRVLAAYPGSSPRVYIKAVSVFQVFVKGEAKSSGVRYAWGLSRLSSLLGEGTAYASDRALAVVSADGTRRTYDLFKARRHGDLTQDPYLRPFDTVEFSRYERQVSIAGAVRRPGAYQLLPGEGVKELVEYYADGLTPVARPDLAVLSRRPDAATPEGSMVFVSIGEAAGVGLRDGDALSVPDRSSYLPVIYVEGAVRTGAEAAAQYGTDRIPWKPGDRLSRVVRALGARILPGADLRRAFVTRGDGAERIAVDLERILFAYEPSIDLELEPEDRLVIPFGSLDIFVTGEVTKSAWINASGLTRLSSAAHPFFTRYSSFRDIVVRSASGDERVYDLFRAERYGEIAQDPYLVPGDTIVVKRAERIVTVAGSVRRPGTYQLLPGEDLSDLVEAYALGFTERADLERLTLVRPLSPVSPTGEKLYLKWSESRDFALTDRDSVSVAGLEELLPVCWFEGAVGAGSDKDRLDSSNRVPYTFVPGERLSSAAKALRGQFSPSSDLQSAFLRRGTTLIPVDLGKYLYDKDFTDDLSLEPGDVVIVPFRQFFVSVSGAVELPGRYPYIPERDWEYYVNLAGGIDRERNSGDALDIVTKEGTRRAKGSIIEPEDSIVVRSNSFVYTFGRISGIIGTVISVASLVLGIIQFTR